MVADGEGRPRLSQRLRRGLLLSPPPTRRPLLFGVAAALVGAGVLAFSKPLFGFETRWFEWGIGALVGFAVTGGGGYGGRLALATALLTGVAVFAGRTAAYRGGVDAQVARFTAGLDHRDYEVALELAAEWRALGDRPTDAEVVDFAAANGYPVDDAAAFRRDVVPTIELLAAGNPSFEQWRAAVQQASAATAPFAGWITLRTLGLELVFFALGVGTAFAIVSRRTTVLIVAAADRRQRLGAVE
ncbi:MAG: hypothetical protein KDE27_05715 [Planctomycetes bacterium]|nr:hypothetical protein [Planctomycetota bacterium]